MKRGGGAIFAVVDWLRDNGPATESEIKDRIGSVPASRLNNALRNAQARRLIHVTRYSTRKGNNARISVWAHGKAPDKEALPDVRGEFGIGRVSSVWDLARAGR